jgi:hypothetical protein
MQLHFPLSIIVHLLPGGFLQPRSPGSNSQFNQHLTLSFIPSEAIPFNVDGV